MLPQGGYAEPEEEQQTLPAEFHSPRRLSIKVRVLGFGLVAGGLCAVMVGLATSVLRYVTRPHAFGGMDVDTPFLPTFIQYTVAYAPFLFLLAGIAAAVEILSKRNARVSSQATEALVRAILRAARHAATESGTAGSAPGEGRPVPVKDPFLKSLNLEIDPPSAPEE